MLHCHAVGFCKQLATLHVLIVGNHLNYKIGTVSRDFEPNEEVESIKCAKLKLESADTPKLCKYVSMNNITHDDSIPVTIGDLGAALHLPPMGNFELFIFDNKLIVIILNFLCKYIRR